MGERPGRLWGRRRPHLQCCVQKERSAASQRGKRGGDGWGRGGEAKGESERGARQQEGRMSGAGGSKGG